MSQVVLLKGGAHKYRSGDFLKLAVLHVVLCVPLKNWSLEAQEYRDLVHQSQEGRKKQKKRAQDIDSDQPFVLCPSLFALKYCRAEVALSNLGLQAVVATTSRHRGHTWGSYSPRGLSRHLLEPPLSGFHPDTRGSKKRCLMSSAFKFRIVRDTGHQTIC